MTLETTGTGLLENGKDRQVVMIDAAGFVIDRSTYGPTLEDDLWEEATTDTIVNE